MAFFGMTKLGTPNLFNGCSRRIELEQKPKRKPIASVPVEEFVSAFEARASKTLSHTVRSIQLPEIFEDCVGRKLEQKELEQLLRYFDIRAGNIRLEEFINVLKRFHADEDRAVKFAERAKTPGEELVKFGRFSNLQLKDMRRRDTRNEFGPMDIFQYPITINQEYGWGIETKRKPKDIFRPHSSTDVTRTEGICLANYYLV